MGVHRVRRISLTILQKHGSLFSQDFEQNKSILDSVAVIRSKALRNRVVGYITAIIREESPEPEHNSSDNSSEAGE